MQDIDVVVIGAGPSGAIISANLNKKGIKVICIEKEKFPRFVIGESLLPNCNTFLKEAGLFEAVKKQGYQYKNGAAFSYKNEYRYFDFCDKTSLGDGTTYQVKRAEFDKVLIDEAIRQGVLVEFETKVENVEFFKDYVITSLSNGKKIKSKFIVDASGYGRVLPRILNLEKLSDLPVRKAYFTHIQDNISEPLYDRNKILITTHPDFREVWFWLIPFSDGRCSIGVVGEPKFLDASNLSSSEILKTNVYKAPMLNRLLKYAKWDSEIKSIVGYSKNVTNLFGDRYILLGNATEFLDPVFSSGVTIALYSASLAAKCVEKFLKNEYCDFKNEYEIPLMYGVNTFRVYVEGWYSGDFQDIIYSKKYSIEAKRAISSILAGYAWDENNPYVVKKDKVFKTLKGYIS